MIHRDDVVGAILAALKSGRPGEVYNVVDDEPVSQLHFFQWLSGPLAKELPPAVAEDPDAVRKRGATNKKVSNRRLKMEIGYQFKYPTFRQGYTAEIQRLEDAARASRSLKCRLAERWGLSRESPKRGDDGSSAPG